ncbi:AcrB/AcrD/AcrF family protein [Rhodovulum sp. ES.010]|nr:AcrB/AcrD/AcrF family protein [Rhodovulum sp. ES.010]
MISTSATLFAVFVPLSFLQGEIGRLFGEFGITLAIAVAVSTFVALSLCPVIAWKVPKRDQSETRFSRAV